MEKQYVETCDCYIGVDRMINEGLGGGHIHTKFQERQLQSIEKSKCLSVKKPNLKQEKKR